MRTPEITAVPRLGSGHASGPGDRRCRCVVRARSRPLIAEATGVAPSVYRPPYGVFSPAGLAIARRRGWEPMLWSRWGKDWRRLTRPQTIARRVTASVAPGDVLLLHDADYYSAR